MNCPKCGSSINNDAKFCGSCGFDLSATQQQNINATEPEEILEEEPVLITQPEQTEINSINNQKQTEKQADDIPVTSQMPQSSTDEEKNNQPHLQQQNYTTVNQPKKKNKTAAVILVIVIVAIVASTIGLVLMFLPNENKKEQEKINETFNTKQLIKVKKDDKYGYINTKGEFVIDAIYDEGTAFKGDYAVVRGETEIDGMRKTVYQLINKKGKTIKQAEEGISYLQEEQVWIIDRELYNDSIKKISKNNVKVSYESDGYFVWVNSKENTGGIMNAEGKQTYTYSFQSGENYISIEPSEIDETLKERYCRINIENDKYAIVNCDTGTIVQDFTTSYISVQDDNIFKLSNHDTYAFIELLYIQGDKKLYSTTSKNVSLTYYPGYVSIYDREKTYGQRYTYLHTATGEIKTTQPNSNTSSSSSQTTVDEWEKYTKNKKMSCGSNYGLTNDETVTLPCEWERLQYLDVELYKYLEDNGKQYIYGEKNDKWYLIDLKNKKAIIEFDTSYITTKSDSTFMYYTDAGTKDKKVYNLLSGKTLNVASTSSLSVYSNYITVTDKNAKTIKYYNTDLKLIYTEEQ